MRTGVPSQATLSPAWNLLAALAAIAWLVPGQGLPWNSFYREALHAAIWLAAGGLLIVRQRGLTPVPGLAALGLAAAVTSTLQASVGLLSDLSQPVVPTLYLAGLALAILVGRLGESRGLISVLMASWLIAGIASSGIGLSQWLKLDLDIMLAPLSTGQRPMGNLGQPNHLATLLAWALVATWWAWARRAIGSRVATLSAWWLLIGLALTQSRTGAVAAGLLGVLALLRLPRRAARPTLVWLCASALWFAALWLLTPLIGDAFDAQAARSVEDTLSAGKRPAIWSLMLDAISRAPLFGYGWGQGGRAHLAVLLEHDPLRVLVTYAHSLPLDLAVWAGIPAAIVLIGALGAWLVTRAARARDTETMLMLAAIGVFTCHALLEMPHAYVYFLVPVGLLIGAVDSQVAPSAALRWPRGPAAALWLALTLALIAVVVDYRAIQDDLLAYRLRAARIGDLTPPPSPAPLLLTDLQRSLEALRIEPRARMPASELDALTRAAERHPGPGSLFRAAQALALNDRDEQAELMLHRLCSLNPPTRCEAARAAWTAWRLEAVRTTN